MTAKIPIRTVFDGDGNATGLAEFQSGEFVDYSYGGTGLTSLGSAGQVLKINSGGTALEYGSVEAVINIDGATDLTGSTLTATDLLLISDGGTEGRVELGQLDTLFSGSTKSLTNKTIDLSNNTLTGTVAEFNIALSDGDFATLAGFESLTNKTIDSSNNTITITEANISDLQSYLTAETNDLTSAVTWANVPDANITQSSVTQHQAALSITESQISDLGAYITASSTDTLTNKTISGASNTLSGSFSGITSLTATTLTDGTATLTSGSLSGIVNITASGTINATSDIQVNGNSVALKPFAIAQAIALG